MEQNELRSWEARCTQEEPPRCKAGCPFNVDGRGFVMAMAAGKLQEARAILEKSMPLVQVTASLCEAECESSCLRKELGGAVAIGLLERSCLAQTTSKARVMKLPPRPKKVATLGSGPSALVCAADLARKGYPITICHAAPRGEWLATLAEQDAERLPGQRLDAELERLEKSGVIFREVPQLDGDLLAQIRTEADAVFIGCDAPLTAQSTSLSEDLQTAARLSDVRTGATADPSIFSGPMSTTTPRYIDSAAAGREAAVSIDRYLQGASLTASRNFPRRGETSLYTDLSEVVSAPRLSPDSLDFSTEQARAEAARCINCQCLVCVDNCEYLKSFKGYPKSLARQIYNNDAIVKGTHLANKLINSCSLCGQCEVLCPNDFSMAELCLQSRRRMVADDRMPPSAHHFALEEMRAAISSRSRLAHHAPGCNTSSAVFFPGCQLAGVRPDQVEALYQDLQAIAPDTGIWLSCCGAPAHWGGRQAESSEIADSLRQEWQQLGEPALICACSSCLQMFHEYLPEIPVISLWSHLEKSGATKDNDGTGLPDGAAPWSEPLAVSDPCSARHDETTRTAVRTLLDRLGQKLSPLKMDGELTECCGYGGLQDNCNPELAAKVGKARVAQSEATMLTYCIMCREQQQKSAGRSLHLLDLLYPETARQPEEPVVSLSDRRENREMLADRMRSTLFARQPEPPEPWRAVKISTSPELRAQMDQRRILLRDVQQLLYRVEVSGEPNHQRIEHESGDHRIAFIRLGDVTIWAQYRVITPSENGHDLQFELLATWSHRMILMRRRQR